MTDDEQARKDALVNEALAETAKLIRSKSRETTVDDSLEDRLEQLEKDMCLVLIDMVRQNSALTAAIKIMNANFTKAQANTVKTAKTINKLIDSHNKLTEIIDEATYPVATDSFDQAGPDTDDTEVLFDDTERVKDEEWLTSMGWLGWDEDGKPESDN